MNSILEFLGRLALIAVISVPLSVTGEEVTHYPQKSNTNMVDPSQCWNTKKKSGYIDFGGNKMFCWYIESQSDPKNDPITFWINGGPRTSSMVGLMLGVGPCYVDKSGNKTMVNNNSWNKKFNLLKFDQPIGTGFSLGPSQINDTIGATQDITGLKGFYSLFPQLRPNELHLASKSYGGHFVPYVALEIVKSGPCPKSNLPKSKIFDLGRLFGSDLYP